MGEYTPVPARQVTGPVRIVFARGVRDVAVFVTATSTGILAVTLAVIGAVVR